MSSTSHEQQHRKIVAFSSHRFVDSSAFSLPGVDRSKHPVDSVFRVQVVEDGKVAVLGSGFVYGGGWVVTNSHVMRDLRKDVQFQFHDDVVRLNELQADQKEAQNGDAGWIQIHATHPEPPSFKHPDLLMFYIPDLGRDGHALLSDTLPDVDVGQSVTVLHFGEGDSQCNMQVSEGEVTSMSVYTFVHTAPTRRGSSGSLVLTKQGDRRYLLGVSVAGDLDDTKYNLALRAKPARDAGNDDDVTSLVELGDQFLEFLASGATSRQRMQQYQKFFGGKSPEHSTSAARTAFFDAAHSAIGERRDIGISCFFPTVGWLAVWPTEYAPLPSHGSRSSVVPFTLRLPQGAFKSTGSRSMSPMEIKKAMQQYNTSSQTKVKSLQCDLLKLKKQRSAIQQQLRSLVSNKSHQHVAPVEAESAGAGDEQQKTTQTLQVKLEKVEKQRDALNKQLNLAKIQTGAASEILGDNWWADVTGNVHSGGYGGDSTPHLTIRLTRKKDGKPKKSAWHVHVKFKGNKWSISDITTKPQ